MGTRRAYNSHLLVLGVLTLWYLINASRHLSIFEYSYPPRTLLDPPHLLIFANFNLSNFEIIKHILLIKRILTHLCLPEVYSL